MRMLDGSAVPIMIRKGRSGDGIPEKHVRIISKLIPIRDAVREVLKAQETDRPWRDLQVRLRIAWSSFVRDFGPINHTTVSVQENIETGEVKETHRQPNLAPFRDDPDRSEEHTSELQSLMRLSYAVFCLQQHKTTTH